MIKIYAARHLIVPLSHSSSPENNKGLNTRCDFPKNGI
jgi:hypothetical protein